jgi:hypothetical protein
LPLTMILMIKVLGPDIKSDVYKLMFCVYCPSVIEAVNAC